MLCPHPENFPFPDDDRTETPLCIDAWLQLHGHLWQLDPILSRYGVPEYSYGTYCISLVAFCYCTVLSRLFSDKASLMVGHCHLRTVSHLQIESGAYVHSSGLSAVARSCQLAGLQEVIWFSLFFFSSFLSSFLGRAYPFRSIPWNGLGSATLAHWK